MSKVMSILEKYNLVEKVNKEKSNSNDLQVEDNIDLGEVSIEENSNNENEDNEIKNEMKEPEVVIKEKSSRLETDITYEKKMMINEIYSLNGLENSNINTVYMLQNLINALPQNLPKDVLKQSVINVINASNIDLNELMSDGKQRLEVLAKVMDGYYNETNRRITEYKQEISRLSSLIKNCQEQIKIKENMLEEQIYEMKYESENIDSIIDFFSK